MLVLLHALIPCLAVYILHLFSYFLALSSLHPSTFNGNVFTPLHCFFLIYIYIYIYSFPFHNSLYVSPVAVEEEV